MKNIWKWILGIVVVLVVVAGLVGMAFVVHNRMAAAMAQRLAPNSQKWNGPAAPDGDPRRIVPPRMGPRMGFRGFGHDGFRGFGRGGFGGFGPFAMGGMFFGMLGRLLPIAILVLLLYGAYQLGKKNVPVVVAAAPAPPPVTPTTHPCPKCENPVQDAWKHCPNCGAEQ
jgi:hypothetical protein